MVHLSTSLLRLFFCERHSKTKEKDYTFEKKKKSEKEKNVLVLPLKTQLSRA